jgi:hypothetical protein
MIELNGAQWAGIVSLLFLIGCALIWAAVELGDYIENKRSKDE